MQNLIKRLDFINGVAKKLFQFFKARKVSRLFFITLVF